MKTVQNWRKNKPLCNFPFLRALARELGMWLKKATILNNTKHFDYSPIPSWHDASYPKQFWQASARSFWRHWLEFVFKIFSTFFLSQLNDPEVNKPLIWKTKLRSCRIFAHSILSWTLLTRVALSGDILRRHLKATSWFPLVPSSTRSKT